MKRNWLVNITIATMVVLLAGCGSTPKKPKIETTSQFHVDAINVRIIQNHDPEIEYHSKDELSSMVKNLLINKLEKKGLLSDAPEMDRITINIDYRRRFVGGDTPIPSDSLAYPTFKYDVQTIKNEQSVKLINRGKLVYNGGFAMNLQVMAGGLRDKSYENKFVEAIANTITKDIDELN